MPGTKVSLCQMVDLALGTPEVGAVNFNVLHSLLHAMLKRLNIIDVQADINEFDRDFLSASKARELSVLSDVDSGRGEDTESISERSSTLPTPSTDRRTPYHHLEVKVAKLQEQLDNITSVPSNKHLFEKARTNHEEKPIGEMWLNMQLMSRVENNEKGIAKCMSMIEDMMKEMQSLKDANKNLMDKVNGLNLDDLMKRLKDLENKMKDMNDRFNLLPSPEDFAHFVTWAGLEDALSGIKRDWENLQPTERVVVEIASQTDIQRDGSAKYRTSTSPQNQRNSRPGSRTEGDTSNGYHFTHPEINTVQQNHVDSGRNSPKYNQGQRSDDYRSAQSRGSMVRSDDGGSRRGTPASSATGCRISSASSHSRPGSGNDYTGSTKNQMSSSDRPKSVHYSEGQNEPSRPPSSRPGTRMSSGSTGPSETLLEILEKLGKLGDSHEALTKRVEVLEEEIKKKVDKEALDNLNLSSDLLEQLQKLKEEVDALAAAREKLGPGSVAEKMLETAKDIEIKASALAIPVPLPASEPVIETGEVEVQEASSSELLLRQHEQEMLNITLEALHRKVETLEERFKLFQDMKLGDTTYQNNVTDLRSWLTEMENRPDPLEGILSVSSSEVVEGSSSETDSGVERKKKKQTKKKKEEKEKESKTEIKEKKESKEEKTEEKSESKEKEVEEDAKTPTKFEQEIMDIFNKDPSKSSTEDMPESPMVMAGDIVICNNKLRTLAYVLNDQLHTVREKIFNLDYDLKKMAKGIEFALVRTKFAGTNELDSDALSRAQAAIQQLQEEVEKLHGTTKDILEENANRSKEIEKLFAYCDKLQEVKADKEYVQSEVDVKADKRSLDNKVNHSLFDTTTNDINKMIKEILDKLAGNEEAWNHQCKRFTDDIEGKLDRLELDPLKEWLENRLKALNEKLKKQNQAPVEWTEDDAAGIRRQLIQKFHCISCDRPVDIVPTGPVMSLPSHVGLNPTRSPRPYTTFELDQIRQHAKRMYAGTDRPGPRSPVGRNNINFERALAEKQLARMRKSDLKAFLVHFGQDIEALREQRDAILYANNEISDYYATTRPCGGQHTTTFPHKRITKLSHLSHLFREEEQTNIYPLYKEEVDVQGQDGNIYKGRMDRIDTKLPVMAKERSFVSKRDRSPQPQRQQITRVGRPNSAKPIHSPRPPSSKGGSRPQSAHPSASQQEIPPAESSHTTPVPTHSPEPPEEKQTIEIPAQS